MPVPSSGAISLNDFHVEAGGTSGTECSLNDADIRGLISKGSGVQMSFNEWYGASGTTTYNGTLAGITAQTLFKSTFVGWLGSPTPTAIFNSAGTLNGSTSYWSVGAYTIKGVQTSVTTGLSTDYILEFYTDITSSSQFQSISITTAYGTATIPSTSFNYSSGFMSLPSASYNNVTNGQAHITNGSISITI